MKRALIIVDLQKDFTSGGSLAVPNGDEVIEIANKEISNGTYDVIVYSQDWHPPNHKSFASNHPGKNVFDIIKLGNQDQVLWPDHCVQNTQGAELHSGLMAHDLPILVIQKGMNPDIDSYSAFFDNDKQTSTGLDWKLKALNVTEIYVMGLATDYCVKSTAIDAVNLHFGDVFLIQKGCRGVSPDSTRRAIEDMVAAGVTIIS